MGGKKKNRREITDAIKTIRFKDRRSLRTMQVALKRKGVDVSLSTLSSIGKECRTIRKKKSRLKPMLTEEHRRKIFKFCSLKVNEKLMTYSSNYDVVHIDEKWFYMTEEGEAYWATAEEDMAYRASKSKRFIKKCMFMAALARPCFDYSRNAMFDGKIGIWPFAEVVQAKRASKNRPKGTPELKPITLFTKAHTRRMIIDKIICLGSSSDTTANKINPFYLIG